MCRSRPVLAEFWQIGRVVHWHDGLVSSQAEGPIGRDPWPRAETLAAAREWLLGPAVTDGFVGLDVRDEADRLVLEFRWMKDPNVYLIAVDYPAPEDADSWPAADPARGWVMDQSILLMEELDTGLVARADRRVRGDSIELDMDQDFPDRIPREYYIGEVFAENEWTIANGGMDPDVPQRRTRDGSLIAWLVVHPNTLRPTPVMAHGSVSWIPGAPGVASLDVLEVGRDVPQEIEGILAETLVFSAAYEGATEVVAGRWAESLQGIGFSARPDGSWSVATVGFRTTS